MRYITFVLAILVALPMLASAQNYTCIDANTSSFNTTIPINGVSVNIGPIIKPCSIGCNNATGRCGSTEPSIGDVGMVVVLALISFIFIFAASREELSFTMHWRSVAIDPIKLLFIGLSLFMIIMDFGIIMNFASMTGQTGVYGILTGGWSGLLWGFVILMVIISLYFMYSIIKTVIDYAKKTGRLH